MSFKITTTAFKETGKYYTSQVGVLLKHHRYMMGFDFEKMVRNNDPDVHMYSGLSGGFSSRYYHVIDIEYPPEVNNFCTRLIDKTKEMG